MIISGNLRVFIVQMMDGLAVIPQIDETGEHPGASYNIWIFYFGNTADFGKKNNANEIEYFVQKQYRKKKEE